MEKNVAILTLSEKHGGKCVAAYDFNDNKIIRLVSDASCGKSIPNKLVRGINLLDVVKIKVIEDCPLEHQTENVLIDLDYGLKKIKNNTDVLDLAKLTSYNQAIFGNDEYKLQNNTGLSCSLQVINFENMELYKSDKNKTKVNFTCNGKQHNNYSVTDNNYFTITKSKIESGFAVISLPPSDDYTRNGGGYFKYVSAIYED